MDYHLLIIVNFYKFLRKNRIFIFQKFKIYFLLKINNLNSRNSYNYKTTRKEDVLDYHLRIKLNFHTFSTKNRFINFQNFLTKKRVINFQTFYQKFIFYSKLKISTPTIRTAIKLPRLEKEDVLDYQLFFINNLKSQLSHLVLLYIYLGWKEDVLDYHLHII